MKRLCVPLFFMAVLAATPVIALADLKVQVVGMGAQTWHYKCRVTTISGGATIWCKDDVYEDSLSFTEGPGRTVCEATIARSGNKSKPWKIEIQPDMFGNDKCKVRWTGSESAEILRR